MPPFPPTALRAAALVAMLLGAAGCGVFKTNEEAQATINQRVVGMQAGDFFDRFGRAKIREPQSDGSIEYQWISAIGETPHRGYYGLDERTCTLHIVASKEGRIQSAVIMKDGPGRAGTSRCLEMFRAG